MVQCVDRQLKRIYVSLRIQFYVSNFQLEFYSSYLMTKPNSSVLNSAQATETRRWRVIVGTLSRE